MATIGLDRLYYAKITENDAGEETYGTPSQLAKAISADLSVEPVSYTHLIYANRHFAGAGTVPRNTKIPNQ